MTLIIDALDEISTQREGDAVNQVLGKLGQLDYPRFILSCRAADWRSATAAEAIREQYEQSPLILHLNPFSDDDALDFLRASLGDELAKSSIEHLNARGLQGFLGNPHTLELVANVAASGNVPDTRSELSLVWRTRPAQQATKKPWQRVGQARNGNRNERDACQPEQSRSGGESNDFCA